MSEEADPTFFPEAVDFRAWLEEHHTSADVLWVGWYRRQSARWVTSAKREETRQRRLSTLIDDSANGLRIKQLRRS